MVHRHGFLCGTEGVEVGSGFQQSLGAGIFGGDGFLLAEDLRHGQAWIELDGEVVPYTLARGRDAARASRPRRHVRSHA